MNRRTENQKKAQLPSSKRRHLILKQERVISQGANEALEGQTYQSVCGQQMPHITQMSAVEPESGSILNCYITSKVSKFSAEKVMGIVLSSSGLTVNGQTEYSEHIQTAVEKFIEWVKKFPSVTLVAHKGRRFDFPVLMSALMKLGIVDKFVLVFVDCLTV